MASLVQKFRTLISANLHFLVDKALQSQSLSVIDDYIRNMTEQMNKKFKIEREHLEDKIKIRLYPNFPNS